LWGSQETSLFVLFLGGTANPEGVRYLTDKAEARRAASAQAAFPSRRAREKAVPEKVYGKNREGGPRLAVPSYCYTEENRSLDLALNSNAAW
jgi:hypothetical protein